MSRSSTAAADIEQRMRESSGPVVVGFDGSTEGEAALAFASALAQRRGTRLRIVTAYTLVVSELGWSVGAPWDSQVLDSIRALAERDADQAVDLVAARHPGLSVERIVQPGPAAAVILDATRDAAVVVVGRHGRNGFLDKLLGGTSREVATHCSAPTIVVRDAVPAGTKVVVGIDGSPDSVGALAFAFDMASRYGYDLVAVHTWDVPPIGAITGVPSPEPAELVRDVADNEARAALEELSGFSDSYPDVHVDHRIVRGSPVHTLVAEAEGAALVVVGSRGRGGFLGLILGSVSHGILHHATCNVAVVTAEGARRRAVG